MLSICLFAASICRWSTLCYLKVAAPIILSVTVRYISISHPCDSPRWVQTSIVWGRLGIGSHICTRAFLSQWFHHESTNDEYCDVNNATMNPGSHAKYQVPQAAKPGMFWISSSSQCFGGVLDKTLFKTREMRLIWLVVWNMTFIFPYIGNNKPNSLIFFRGVET